jgi:hypothetical protein
MPWRADHDPRRTCHEVSTPLIPRSWGIEEAVGHTGTPRPRCSTRLLSFLRKRESREETIRIVCINPLSAICAPRSALPKGDSREIEAGQLKPRQHPAACVQGHAPMFGGGSLLGLAWWLAGRAGSHGIRGAWKVEMVFFMPSSRLCLGLYPNSVALEMSAKLCLISPALGG